MPLPSSVRNNSDLTFAWTIVVAYSLASRVLFHGLYSKVIFTAQQCCAGMGVAAARCVGDLQQGACRSNLPEIHTLLMF